jgi:hypothetical protein
LNTLVTNTYSLVSLTETNGYSTANLGAAVTVTVVPNPTAVVIGSTTVCSGEAAIITVTNTGVGPWTNIWNDNVTNIVGGTGPFVFTRSVITTNNGLTVVTNTYSLVSLTETNGYSTTNLGASVVIRVDPILTNPPVVVGTNFVITCFFSPITFAVSVPSGFTADWYDINNSNKSTGTAAYQPPLPADLGANGALTNIYYAASRFVDPANTNAFSVCDSTVVTTNTVVYENCLETLSFSPTNIIFQWFGTNVVLQSTTNLAPAVWVNVYTGATAAFFNFTNYIQPPTNLFFRLNTN